VSVVELYGKADCCLCDEAREVLERMRDELAFELIERDITTDERLHRAYFERIPVVLLDGHELFEYHVDEQVLRARLSAGGDHLESGR